MAQTKLARIWDIMGLLGLNQCPIHSFNPFLGTLEKLADRPITLH